MQFYQNVKLVGEEEMLLPLVYYKITEIYYYLDENFNYLILISIKYLDNLMYLDNHMII